MNTKKQLTAVEWLTDKFYANEGIMKSEWLEQAKELEHAKHQVLKMESKSELEYEAHKAYLYGLEVGFMKAKERELEQHKSE